MTIDHAAEARDALTTAHDFAGDEEFAFADLTLKAAQVHATLALVEQQRIANVLTYVNVFGESDVNLIDRDVIDDIKKGLGL